VPVDAGCSIRPPRAEFASSRSGVRFPSAPPRQRPADGGAQPTGQYQGAGGARRRGRGLLHPPQVVGRRRYVGVAPCTCSRCCCASFPAVESITKAPAASSVSLFGTLHVVVAIAREPVDLVHDDEVGALLSHEAHQLRRRGRSAEREDSPASRNSARTLAPSWPALRLHASRWAGRYGGGVEGKSALFRGRGPR
jgi:hypothetical protein